MKIHTIKFSHQYEKMPRADCASLLQVFKIHYKDLSEFFIHYDTQIYNSSLRYDLPKTDLIVLLLRSPMGAIWTTVRRWTPQKEIYYRGIMGQMVQIKITESE